MGSHTFSCPEGLTDLEPIASNLFIFFHLCKNIRVLVGAIARAGCVGADSTTGVRYD